MGVSMSQPKLQYGIHCNECQFEGPAKTNSSNIFLIFFALLCLSIFFLPLIIVALIYMAIAIAKPAKKSCPTCKSTNIIDLELKSVKEHEENVANANKSQQV